MCKLQTQNLVHGDGQDRRIHSIVPEVLASESIGTNAGHIGKTAQTGHRERYQKEQDGELHLLGGREKKNMSLVPCSVELLETFGDDLTVVNAARVSLAKESSELNAGDAKLIQYLVKHHHESPFFHPQARFRIKIPIFLAREWFRHTIGFARNEVSRRYVDSPPQFFMPSELRGRAPTKKQGSDEVNPFDPNVSVQCSELIRESVGKAYVTYELLLRDGLAPEQARMILPQNMMTEFIETGSLAAYARLCRLRLGPDAQKEIREVAQLISAQMERAFPVSWNALKGDFA